MLSKSSEDAYNYALGEGLDDDTLDAWRFLCESATPYPAGEFIPPFRAPTGPARTRGIIGAHLDSRRGEREGYPIPSALWLSDGSNGQYNRLSGTADDVDTVSQALFTKENRSKLIVFKHGAKSELRLIAQRWGLALDALGFTVELMVNGGKLRAIIVKKSKHRWYLVDWQGITGRPPDEMTDYARRSGRPLPFLSTPANAVWAATTYVQQFIRRHFGVGLGLTIGATALRAAARSLPEEVLKWRPLPVLVSMMRHGKGFRGGVVRGQRYRGASYMVDLNRAYTAALASSLPLRSAIGQCVRDGAERPGVYVCRVRGPSRSPIFLGAWSTAERRFESKWTLDRRGEGVICVLPTSEYDGIRALGCTIEPAIGCLFTRTFSLAAYVGRIQAIVDHFGPRSLEAKLSKLLGNAVYGKFASDPERRTVRLSNKRPGLDWFIWIDSDGLPVEQVWEQSRVSYQWSQHVDIAGVVTGRVRSWLYAAETLIQANGGHVQGIQTDCLISTIDPRGILPLDDSRIGAWRLVEEDADGVVAGPNCWAVGDHIAVPQHPHPTRPEVVALFESCYVEFESERRGTPLPGVPLVTRVVKRIAPPALAP